MALIACLLGYFKARLERAEAQRDVVARLRWMGARVIHRGDERVLVDDPHEFGQVESMLDGRNPSCGRPEGILAQLQARDFHDPVVAVDFHIPTVRHDAPYEDVTDSNVQVLGTLHSLRILRMARQDVAHCGWMANLQELEELDISRTRIGDDSVAVLSGLRKLRTLGVHPGQFSPSAIDTLRQLPNLDVWEY